MADFQVDVQLLKPARGKTIFVFEKKSQPIQNSLDFTQAETEDIGYVALLVLLPVERRSQKTMKKMLQAHYQRFGYDYVARNIRYAMKNSKKNFRKFFEQSLVNDWGLSMIEDEEAAAQAKQIQSERVRQEHELQKTEEKQRLLEQELLNRAREYQSNLSGTALEKLRQEAILRLDPQIQEATKQHKPAARVPLKMAMDKISIERMHINPPTPAEKEKTQES